MLLIIISLNTFAASAPSQTVAETEYGKVMIVAGKSMAPTINPGDKIRVLKVKADALKNGDLVAIKFKTRKRPMLKRIIAVGGDKVEIIDGRMRINDEWLDTQYWPKERRTPGNATLVLKIQLGRYGNKVPKNNIILFGDNAQNSFDSGRYGLLQKSQVVGLVEKVK